MSNSIDQLPVIGLSDSQIHQDVQAFAIRKGLSNVVYQNINVQGSLNNSSLQFSFVVPDLKTVVSKRFFHDWVIQVDASSPDSGKKCVSYGLYDGFRQMPINQVIDNQSLSMANMTVSNSNAEYLSALLRYMPKCNMDSALSTSCMYPDTAQEYTDSLLSAKSPFSNYTDSHELNGNGRCALQPLPWSLAVNTNTQYSQRFRLQECVLISPLSQHNTEFGLIGLQSVALTFNFRNLTNMWSHDSVNGSTFTSFSITLVSANLGLQYLTISPLMQMPNKAIYDYLFLDRYSTSVGTIPYSSTTIQTQQVILNSVQLSSIPDHIYVFLQETYASQTYTSCNSFPLITGLNITMNQDVSLLATASEYDIFRISQQNGFQGDYHLWVNNGSIVKLIFGKDIVLPSSLDLSSGVSGSYTLQVQLTVRNINSTDPNISYTGYLVVASAGTYTLFGDQQQAVIQRGFITKDDVLNAQNAEQSLTDNDVRNEMGGSLIGGSCCGGILPISKILKGVSTASRVGSDVAESFGLGKGFGGCSNNIKSEFGGRKRLMHGGQILSNESLMNRAMKKNI